MSPVTSTLIATAAGAASWSFAEYAIHNWVGHLSRGRNEFSREHLAHHRDGSYFTPTLKKARMALTVLVVVAPLAVLAVGPVAGLGYSAGFLAAYVGYELLHRRCHTHAPWGRYGRWARKHHFYHHFASPKTNHGVTSPLWDLVFRTYRPPGQVRVPAKHAMVWLVDPGTGEVKPEYREDYVIARKGDKRIVRAAQNISRSRPSIPM